METFNELALPQPLVKALKDLNFEKPTPIQTQAIPVALTGADLIGCAQTGTGKTAAFAIPAVAHVLQEPKNRVLVLTPTRELAEQIANVIYDLTKYAEHLRGALVIGGASMGRQIKDLKQNPSFIVATPGRLFDHLEQRTVKLSDISHLILDEADRMLDMGFAPQIDRILKHVPSDRQTLLFSATLPKNILSLASRYMKKAQRVSVGQVGQPISAIKQSAIEVEVAHKNSRVLEEIRSKTGTTIVFARTQRRTEKLAIFLDRNGVNSQSIHGGRTQSQRRKALEDFRSGQTKILVATDVASRGLDIPHIETVINFDLPQTSEDYVHRIGRTARAGAKGEAITFYTPDERRAWKSMQKAAA